MRALINVCWHVFTVKYVAHATCGDLKYVPSKFEENPSKNKRTLNHARIHTCALARVRAMREYEKYVAYATCGDLKYVPSKFKDNPFKDK
jgi:hypothetical protein